MPLFTRASGFAVHGSSFTDVARDVNTSVHVHVQAQQASFEVPGSGSCSRKRNRDSDKDEDDHDTTLQIVKRRRLELQSVLTHGSSYQLHAARQSGKAVVAKVFGGPRAEEHFAANLTSCRRHLHPNVGQMIGKSPDGSEPPFIIYRSAEPISRLHPLIAKALRTDLLRSVRLAMTTALRSEFICRTFSHPADGFPLQTSSHGILDILVGDNDEPVIGVNPDVATLGAPSNDRDQGWAAFSSLCRETFKEVNTILYDDTPNRNHVDYESSSRPKTPTLENITLEPVENDNMELASSALTLAQPNKTRRELWWIEPEHRCLSLNSVARRFDNFLASIPSSSLSPLRQLYNSEERRPLHRCPGYLREEILLGSDLAKSVIVSHSTPDLMERCSVCGELVSPRAGSEGATEVSDKVVLPGALAGKSRKPSGCFTCRIRRKKCDERPNEAGECETCVRLRIECLGFGAKLPEWLRGNRNVMELRHEIKTFLAAQSMIKGHSGSGPHSRGHERPMLRLTVDLDNYSVSSGSPSTPTLSLSTENVHTLPISATLRSVSPYGGSSQGSVHDFTPYHHLPLLDTSTSLASPAITSSFSNLYNFNIDDDDDLPIQEDVYGYGMFKLPTLFVPPVLLDTLNAHIEMKNMNTMMDVNSEPYRLQAQSQTMAGHSLVIVP